jgi:hypothetical protein
VKSSLPRVLVSARRDRPASWWQLLRWNREPQHSQRRTGGRWRRHRWRSREYVKGQRCWLLLPEFRRSGRVKVLCSGRRPGHRPRRSVADCSDRRPGWERDGVWPAVSLSAGLGESHRRRGARPAVCWRQGSDRDLDEDGPGLETLFGIQRSSSYSNSKRVNNR